jgi:predicted ATPase
LNLDSPKGLMLHGEVGTGKSMLIDLFADCLPNRKKRRTHFNTFMLETFAKLEALRTSRARSAMVGGRNAFGTDDEHSLLWLAKEMVHTSPILFLDEFQMPDRVASKLLTGLMTGFFQLGGVLVATSNRMPEELAKAAGVSFNPAPQRSFGWGFGLRRNIGGGRHSAYNEFAAFLEVLRARCEVWEVESKRDYRRVESGSVAPVKGIDLDDLERENVVVEEVAESEEKEPTVITMPQHYIMQTPSEASADDVDAMVLAEFVEDPALTSIPWQSSKMQVYGRTIDIPRSYKGVTKWTFDELCKKALGPADYISLASTYSTLILTDVPVLDWKLKNEARRLITLLDALYECRCKLLVTAAAGPDDIFFPEEKQKSAEDGGDSVYSETLSEVYQDATAPFRPNILTENPNYAEPTHEPDYTHARLSGLLRADSLEDDAPPTSRGAKGGSESNPFGRSFGMTDADLQRGPIDPDEVRHAAGRPNFQNTSKFTGEDERFAYKRAQSRLWEMCSAKWWARQDEGWWRPTPVEVRGWERVGQSGRESSGATQAAKETEIMMGGAKQDESRPAESFKKFEEEKLGFARGDGTEEKPRKVGWVHFWGTTKWPGKRAGVWGKGVDGVEERQQEKGLEKGKAGRGE